MVGVEGPHLHAVLPDDGARQRLHHVEAEGQSADHRMQRVEQGLKARRAYEKQFALTPAQPVGLEHSREPEEVVPMQVGKKDCVDVGEPEPGTQQLALGALAAVDQPARTTARHQCGGRPPRGARHRRGRTDECDLKIHGLTLLDSADELDRKIGSVVVEIHKPHNKWPIALHLDHHHRVVRLPAPVGGATGVDDHEAVGRGGTQGNVRVPERDGGAAGKPLSKAREPARLGAPVVHQAKPAPAGQLHLCRGWQQRLHRVVISVAIDRNHRGADCRQLGEARHVGEVARVDNGIRHPALCQTRIGQA